jgi:pimeloyl-ACP methyl ester carboxylesterase
MPLVPLHLLTGDGRLVYELAFNGAVLGHQHTLDHGSAADGSRHVEFLTEIDPGVLGRGGSAIATRAHLYADGALKPIRYESRSATQSLSLDFLDTSVRAILPDGDALVVDGTGGVQFLLEGNVLGELAILLGDLGSSADKHRWCVMMVGQLLVTFYEVWRAGELDRENARGFRSSLKEELWIDERGGLVEWRMPAHGISAILLREPPPLPDWYGAELPALSIHNYVPPGDVHLEDVTIDGPTTPIGATISAPLVNGHHPGVLFLAGSGRHDRHGIAGEVDIGTHEIMDHLARHGFVGLRSDTRGAGTTKLGADVLDRGLDALFDDARACLRFLRDRPEIGGAPVWLIGHSQGGLVALELARSDPTAIRGVALLAVPGRGIDQVMADQIRGEGERLGCSAEQIEEQLRDLAELVQFARDGRAWTPERVPPHVLARIRSRPWLADHLKYAADRLLPTLQAPLLVCQGGKDIQVSPDRDMARLVTLATDAHIPFESRLYPELDHLFKPVSGPPSVRQYYDRSRHVDPVFLADLTAWLKRA